MDINYHVHMMPWSDTTVPHALRKMTLTRHTQYPMAHHAETSLGGHKGRSQRHTAVNFTQ